MLRKKTFDHHIKSLEDALDSEEDEEWDAEITDQEPDTDIEDINADDIAPPAEGHTDGERVIGTTNKSSAFHYETPFRESLEDKLCALLEDAIDNVNTAGGAVPAIRPITPIGTATKKQVNDASKEEDKPSAKDLRGKSEPSVKYNLNRGQDAKTDETEQTTSGSEEAPEETQETAA